MTGRGVALATLLSAWAAPPHASAVPAGVALFFPSNGTWFAPPMIPDGKGGFIKCWVSYAGPPGTEKAGPVVFSAPGGQGAGGMGAWEGGSAAGLSVSVTMGGAPGAAPGGAVSGYRSGQSRLYAQRVNAQGQEVWPGGGRLLATSFGWIEPPALVADELGNAIVAWSQVDADYNVYAQKLSPDGAPLWEAPGVPVSVQARQQRFPMAASDGRGGAFLAWQDSRNGDVDVFVQHVDGKGKPSWPAGGAQLTGTRDQFAVSLSSDLDGGVWVTWYEEGFPGSVETFSLHLDARGRPVSKSAHWWREF